VELLALQALTWPAEQPRYDWDEAMKSANVVSPNLSTHDTWLRKTPIFNGKCGG